MLKKIFLLFVLSSINCFANKPITCSDISQKLNPQIVLMIKSICNSNYFNNNIRFITNTTDVNVDSWIKKAFFIIINEKSNIALSPYNNIFKQIAIQPTASTVDYHNFIKLSESQKLPNYNWLQQVNNISSLISVDVNAINKMFNNTLDYNLPQDIASAITKNTNNNNPVITSKNSTSGVTTCNYIDPKLDLWDRILIENMCHSTYINNNTRFITNTTNVVVDEWLAKGFFVIFNKKPDLLISPYNNIFKQIAILPSGNPYDYHKLFNLSVAQNKLPYKWLQEVDNTSSLIATPSFAVLDMFSGFQPYTITPFTINPFITNIDTDTSKTKYIIMGSLIGCATIIFIAGLIYTKIYKKRQRRSYSPI
jgi:hypothetical protein